MTIFKLSRVGEPVFCVVAVDFGWTQLFATDGRPTGKVRGHEIRPSGKVARSNDSQSSIYASLANHSWVARQCGQ